MDICNRAAQHCGVARISDFTEDSLQAQEFAFVYDKLRRAEMRRNVWQFSIHNAALRPLDAGTMFLNPELWSSTTTYGFGALVSDQSNFLWQSRAQDNLNNSPGNSFAWEAYFGPLTVEPYDTSGTTGYFAGEMVYQTPGDGTYGVYLSLQSGNAQDPRVPSQWQPTTQYSKDQVVSYYLPWVIGTTYAAGATISYNGLVYVSLAGSNTGNEPDKVPTKWASVSVTLAPPYYNSATAYTPGQFVTYLSINYVNILASTGTVPIGNTSVWVPQAGAPIYFSEMDFNLNNPPSPGYAVWSSGTTYTTGQQVAASDGSIYSSVGNGNLGNDPTLTTGFWTNTGVLNPWLSSGTFGVAANQWLTLNVALTDLIIPYPLGSGPAWQAQTRNLYRLPSNFLRRAPQDPKAGSVSYMGAPSGLAYEDWNLTNQYIVSADIQPIIFRFCADVTDVTAMDDMFCEGLAARIALETVERITQSTAKLQTIALAYKQFMTEARTVNGIETGAVEPPVDDWIQCRM